MVAAPWGALLTASLTESAGRWATVLVAAELGALAKVEPEWAASYSGCCCRDCSGSGGWSGESCFCCSCASCFLWWWQLLPAGCPSRGLFQRQCIGQQRPFPLKRQPSSLFPSQARHVSFQHAVLLMNHPGQSSRDSLVGQQLAFLDITGGALVSQEECQAESAQSGGCLET